VRRAVDDWFATREGQSAEPTDVDLPTAPDADAG
jgi:hypothetical protein